MREVPINWGTVAKHYDGIIIAPYIWSQRMATGWYYTWDCASGCIWNLNAINTIQPAEQESRQ